MSDQWSPGPPTPDEDGPPVGGWAAPGDDTAPIPAATWPLESPAPGYAPHPPTTSSVDGWGPPAPARRPPRSAFGAGSTPPSTGGPSATVVLIVTVVVAFALVGASVGTFVVTRQDGEASGLPAAAADTSTSPRSPSPVEPGADPRADDPPAPPPGVDPTFEEVVAEISVFVEAERGREFLEPVEVVLLNDGDFEARLADEIAEEAEDIEISERILKALGLIEPDVSLLALQESLFSDAVLGYYDPADGALVVRGASPSPYSRITIAHELTHALDDQHFDLDRPEVDEDATDDAYLAYAAIVEGNATVVDEAYRDALSRSERDEADREQNSFGEDFDFASVPLFLLQSLVFPYQHGPPIVEDALADGGPAAVDALLADPPITTEQILVEAARAAGERPVPMARPAADGDELDRGSLGQFLLESLLVERIGPIAARSAARGWGNDAYVLWAEGDASCVRMHVTGDDGAETAELEAAFAAWSESHGAAEVDREGEIVQVTACEGTVTLN